MTHYLIISAIGKDRPGIVRELSAAILEQHCNIDDSRMAILGGEFAIILMVSGEASHVDQLRRCAAALERTTGLTILLRDTTMEARPQFVSECMVEIIAMDQPGIVHKVTGFFADLSINIQSLETETYPAPHTGTPMFALTCMISLPSELPLDSLQQRFQALCHTENLDGTLEATS